MSTHVKEVGDTLYKYNVLNDTHVEDIEDSRNECTLLNVTYVRDVEDTVYTYMYVLIILSDFLG